MFFFFRWNVVRVMFSWLLSRLSFIFVLQLCFFFGLKVLLVMLVLLLGLKDFEVLVNRLIFGVVWYSMLMCGVVVCWVCCELVLWKWLLFRCVVFMFWWQWLKCMLSRLCYFLLNLIWFCRLSVIVLIFLWLWLLCLKGGFGWLQIGWWMLMVQGLCDGMLCRISLLLWQCLYLRFISNWW